MSNGTRADGTVQEFYFPDDHPEYPGWFKGMDRILQDRGISTENWKAQCGQKFSDCPAGATACCCRRALYNQPDFINGESLLESSCKVKGFPILFLPKFHCKLNFIEQCWGAAKHYYRLLPRSSKDDVLEANVLASLEQITLPQMRKWVYIIP